MFLKEAFISMASKFKIPSLNKHQKLGIKKIVLLKKDVFVNINLHVQQGLENL